MLLQVLSESINWMATAVEDFGLGTLDVKALIDNMKVDLASTNATIRNAAISLLTVAHKQLGPGLADMLRSDVKPALMTALEDAFKRNPQEQVCSLNPSVKQCGTSSVDSHLRSKRLSWSGHICRMSDCRLVKVLMHGQLVGQSVMVDLGMSGMMSFCLTFTSKI